LRNWVGNVAEGDLAATYTNRTGGGGRHFYLNRGDEQVKTRKNFRPGIDIIADTGYVIAAGSTGAAADYACINDVDPAAVPSWLRDELLASTKSDTVQPAADGEDWVATKLRGVPEGERNDTAARLAGHFLGRGESQEVVESLLCNFVARCGGPTVPESEIRATAKSIARAEASKRANRFEEISELLSLFARRVAIQQKRRMLIDSLIPEGGVLIHGQPRARKSLFVLESVVSVATGTPAFGLDAFTSSDPVPAWYITDEDSERDVLTRIEAFCLARCITSLSG
jgi:hypothetical protein